MANSDIPRGAIPVKHRSGARFAGGGSLFYIPSGYNQAVFRGDPIIHITDSSDANGVPVCNLATAGDSQYISGFVLGTVAGGDPAVPVLWDDSQYHKAATAGYVLVCADPEVLFEIQEDGDGGAMGVGAVGRNTNLVAGTGSTATGYSGWELNSSDLATSNARQMRIVEAVARADNDPTLTHAKWLCSVNLHSFRNLTGV